MWIAPSAQSAPHTRQSHGPADGKGAETGRCIAAPGLQLTRAVHQTASTPRECARHADGAMYASVAVRCTAHTTSTRHSERPPSDMQHVAVLHMAAQTK